MSSGISSTSDISWIRLALSARYPRIVEDKGADLDSSGQIEGNETFGDLDRSGAIDDKDFQKYLERNGPSIANQIEFIGMKGKEISDDNIINHLMLVESQSHSKKQVQEAYEKLNAIIAKAKERVKGMEDPGEKLNSVYRMLKEDFHITFKDQDNSLFTYNLLHDELDCDMTVFLFLAIAHECGWPLYAVRAPGHVFMRWDSDKIKFNYYAGKSHSDKDYQEAYNIDKDAIKNGVYLSSLSSKETLALFYHNRGDAKCGQGRFQEAIEDHSKALALYPKYPEAYNSRGIAEIELEKHQEAFADFTRAIEFNPGFAEAYNNRGNIRNKSGDAREALTDINKAIDLNPKLAPAYYNRAIVEKSMDRYPAAIKDLERAIKLKPDYAAAYYSRGNIEREEGDFKKAREDYQKADSIIAAQKDALKRK